MLDGADATIYIGGQFGESSPSMEALEEFKVQTSGMSAEYGRTGGGVFNFVMKSGTNQISWFGAGIHPQRMDGRELLRQQLLRPAEAEGPPARLGRHHSGGPVLLPKIYNGKDKTFFYVAYERYKESYAGGGSPTVTVPLDEFWAGNLSRLLTNEVIGKDALGPQHLSRRDLRPGDYQDREWPDGSRSFRRQYHSRQAASLGPAQKLGAIFKQHYSPTLKGPTGRLRC